MASIYTDAEREERYDKLRRKKRQLEKILDILMWGFLIFAALLMIGGISSGLLGGLLGGGLGDFFDFLVTALLCAAAIYVIYAKKIKHTLIALGAGVLLMALTGMGSVIPLVAMIACIPVDIAWGKLEKEEGFPLFDISYAEREERQKASEQMVYQRALDAGVRIASTEQTSDMGDLLDAGHDAMVIAAPLRGSQDRFRGAVPDAVPQQSFQPGLMDTLEQMDAPKAAEEHTAFRDPNVPEIRTDQSALPTLDMMDAPVSAPPAPAPQPAAPAPDAALYDHSADDEILGAIAALGTGPKPQ